MQRYLGIDAHSKSSTVYVMNAAGKKVRQDVVETNGQALIGHLGQIPGQLHVCLEEGEWSAWLHEILEPHVAEIVVEQPPERSGSKSDAIDARGLAERLRTGQIETEVYKAPRRFAKLRELARTYGMLTEDVVRTKNRLRSAYRRRAIRYPGHGLLAQAKALPALPAWMRQPVEALGVELASIEELRGEIEEAMVAESRRFPISRILQTAPGMGPIRVAQMLPIVITPHRFRTKRQFWSYCGFGVVTRTSSDWIQLELAQTWESWECLFVDDGSSDRPRELLEQLADPRIRYFRLDVNRGRGAARQLALERARGEFHAMLDADDWLYPQRLAAQLELFHQQPGLDLVGCGVAVVDSADRLVGVRRRGCRGPAPEIRGPLTSLLRLPVGHASSMVRMAAARRAGYDPSARRFEDREFLLQVLTGGRFGILPRPLYAYRETERLDPAAVRASLRSARAVYRRHRRRLGTAYLPARVMLAARAIAYRTGGALGLEHWLLDRRSAAPSAAERRAFERAREAVRAVRRERLAGQGRAGPTVG